jgi:hypothetical protein
MRACCVSSSIHTVLMLVNSRMPTAPSSRPKPDRFDLHQYVTRCYGSLTTFNVLFKNKEDQFKGGA